MAMIETLKEIENEERQIERIKRKMIFDPKL